MFYDCIAYVLYQYDSLVSLVIRAELLRQQERCMVDIFCVRQVMDLIGASNGHC